MQHLHALDWAFQKINKYSQDAMGREGLEDLLLLSCASPYNSHFKRETEEEDSTLEEEEEK